jgi:hypothetical protein
MRALVIGLTLFGNRQNDRYRIIVRPWPFVFSLARRPGTRSRLACKEVRSREWVWRLVSLEKIPDWRVSI